MLVWATEIFCFPSWQPLILVQMYVSKHFRPTSAYSTFFFVRHFALFESLSYDCLHIFFHFIERIVALFQKDHYLGCSTQTWFDALPLCLKVSQIHCWFHLPGTLQCTTAVCDMARSSSIFILITCYSSEHSVFGEILSVVRWEAWPLHSVSSLEWSYPF